MSPDKETDIYKTITLCLSSALLTLMAAYYTAARNAVTHEEMPGLILQYSPYTGDQKDIRTKLDELYQQNGQLHSEVQQLQIDIARISEKVGVTAHPGRIP